MATWTKVFDGMPKGGSATQAGLEAINSQVEANSAAIPKSVEYDLTIANKAGAGSPATAISGSLRREGGSVFLNATYSTNGSGASGTVAVIQVPAGFRPVGTNKNYFLTNDASQFCYISSGGVINSVATNNSCSVTGSWSTDDDYPS